MTDYFYPKYNPSKIGGHVGDYFYSNKQLSSRIESSSGRYEIIGARRMCI